MSVYIHYGCGLDAPAEWLNFDASPTLRLQKMPLIGQMVRPLLNVVFPDNVRYGDIIKGLPVLPNTAKGIYCSHTLEHLSLYDLRQALRNTYNMLNAGGCFRLVVPDLEQYIAMYTAMQNTHPERAAMQFMELTLLGKTHRDSGLKGLITSWLGNSHHLWMWDYESLKQELIQVGFKQIRRCRFNDGLDPHFAYVERESRFESALAIECIK